MKRFYGLQWSHIHRQFHLASAEFALGLCAEQSAPEGSFETRDLNFSAVNVNTMVVLAVTSCSVIWMYHDSE